MLQSEPKLISSGPPPQKKGLKPQPRSPPKGSYGIVDQVRHSTLSLCLLLSSGGGFSSSAGGVAGGVVGDVFQHARPVAEDGPQASA